MKACSRCGGEHDRQGQRYCCACHAAYMRDWRIDHPLRGEARKKAVTRSYARAYEKRGKLRKKPCKVCGDGNSEKHHPDYNRPLYVVWLCRKHHLEHHRNERSLTHVKHSPAEMAKLRSAA